MAKSIELFYHPASFYSQKVRMYLEEKGISAKLHIINHHKGENLTDSFLKMNPAGKIPVIRCGDTAVPDSDEIFKFGEDNIPGKSLVPSHIAKSVWSFHDEIHGLNIPVVTFGCFFNAKYSKDIQIPRAIVAMFSKRMKSGGMIKNLEDRLASASKDLVPVIEAKLEDTKKFMKAAADEEALEAALKSVDDVLAKCESQIEESSGSFLFGEIVTIADIDLAVLMIRLAMLGLDKRYFPAGGSRKHLTRFIEEMEKRDSFRMIRKESIPLGLLIREMMLPMSIAAVIVVAVAVSVGFLIKRYR